MNRLMLVQGGLDLKLRRRSTREQCLKLRNERDRHTLEVLGGDRHVQREPLLKCLLEISDLLLQSEAHPHKCGASIVAMNAFSWDQGCMLIDPGHSVLETGRVERGLGQDGDPHWRPSARAHLLRATQSARAACRSMRTWIATRICSQALAISGHFVAAMPR